MAGLWQFTLLCWAWSPLCLSSRVSFIGSPKECEKAHFVPGYNLGGEGFDVVTMEKKVASVIDTESWKLANGTCRMYTNSNMKRQKQKVPVAVVDWRTLPKCSLKVYSTVYDSVETLVKDSTSSVSNDWKAGLNLSVDAEVMHGPIYGGSRCKDFTFAMEKLKGDRYAFIHHSVSCNFYRYRLATKPPLSQEFQSAVDSLPSYSEKTEESYRRLIDTYGTHYITQVTLGGGLKAITAIRICEAAIKGLSATEISDCLAVEASSSFVHPNSIKAMMGHCKEKRKKASIPSFSGAFNERSTDVSGGTIDGVDILFQGQSNPSVYRRWIDSLKRTPGVVQYSLKALHSILPSSHSARVGLKREVEKYIERNALWQNCSKPCSIGRRTGKRDACACVCNSNQMVKSNCCPAGRRLATLKVFGLYAKSLYGDRLTQTDGSVVVKLDNQVKCTAIIPNNDNPKWSEVFEFGPIKISRKKQLLFSVYDQDTYWNSDQLGRCSVSLRSGNVTDSCMFTHGTFFFSYSVECAPSLGGLQCQDYVPTPASPVWTEVFHNRSWLLLESQRNDMAKGGTMKEL
ncbi:perforin-1-like [Cololabis saira]|uniref:perforin-1-like n=1 Tax=Cololabis saira TaxID=129043 RepID=UPI002AD30A27|nr:perforin-1-like [Cololabis saira]